MSTHTQAPTSRRQYFVLGLWREPGVHPGQPDAWHFSLESSQTAERRGFANLAELAAYLEVWMRSPPGGETPSSPNDV